MIGNRFGIVHWYRTIRTSGRNSKHKRVYFCIDTKLQAAGTYYKQQLDILVNQKISFGDLPKFSGGENQLAHRILCTQFS